MPKFGVVFKYDTLFKRITDHTFNKAAKYKKLSERGLQNGYQKCFRQGL